MKTSMREFYAAGGKIVSEYDARFNRANPEPFAIWIVESGDEFSRMEDLKGDAFDPRHNPGISSDELAAEEARFERRVQDQGVWRYRAQIFDGASWLWIDEIGGFVGSGFEGSGYDEDMARALLEEREKLESANERAVGVAG